MCVHLCACVFMHVSVREYVFMCLRTYVSKCIGMHMCIQLYVLIYIGCILFLIASIYAYTCKNSSNWHVYARMDTGICIC